MRQIGNEVERGGDCAEAVVRSGGTARLDGGHSANVFARSFYDEAISARIEYKISSPRRRSRLPWADGARDDGGRQLIVK
jgi:hypothetical protein